MIVYEILSHPLHTKVDAGTDMQRTWWGAINCIGTWDIVIDQLIFLKILNYVVLLGGTETVML